MILFVAACGSDGDSTFGTSSGGTPDGGSSSGNPPPAFGDTDGGNTGGGCSSKILCGSPATCCAAGQECVESACVAACSVGVHCGSVCCGNGQVCLAQQCTNPGKACLDSFDCEENEFCEPTLQKCLPQPPQSSLCAYKPTFSPFNPVVEWAWTTPTVKPDFNQVINTPMVMDLDGDGIPEVIVVTSKDTDGFGQGDPAYLRVLKGKPATSAGEEVWGADVEAYLDANQVNPRGTPAVADVDGDGQIEIIVPRKGGGLLMFDKDGHLLRTSRDVDDVTFYNPVFNSVTVAVADMDNDGKAEIVAGGIVFDHTLRLVDASHKGHELWGTNDPSYGAVSIIADVDGNPTTNEQYVVTGNRAIRKSGGTPLWDRSSGAGSLSDGYPAIADLDGDGTPELVVVAQGNIRVQNAITGELIDQIDMPGTGNGGPPTIADFDGDGKMDFSSANGTRYTVFKYDPSVQAPAHKISRLWAEDHVTQDGSSNVTGSSVFDFEGDGKAEVVYNDECFLRVYAGPDGAELFKLANSSATIHENPVLVDVDGDNNTEFVVVANDRNHIVPANPIQCGYTGDQAPRHGVFVFGDANDKWVRTRKLWNQHAYHITNISGDGKVPQIETRSFTTDQNNNYRVSAQGKGTYNAPDLRVDIEVSLANCPASVDLRVRVRNAGSLGVPAGVNVVVYAGADANAPVVASKKTTRALLPGEVEAIVVTPTPQQLEAGNFFAKVDGAISADLTINECLSDNNTAGTTGARCPSVN